MVIGVSISWAGVFSWIILRLWMQSIVVLEFLCVFFSVLFFPSVILLVKKLRKAERTIYEDFVTQIRSSVVYFFALGWHVALLWPAFGPDLGNRSGPPKCHHSMLHVGQIIIPHVPDVGRILADNILLSGDFFTIDTKIRVNIEALASLWVNYLSICAELSCEQRNNKFKSCLKIF